MNFNQSDVQLDAHNLLQQKALAFMTWCPSASARWDVIPDPLREFYHRPSSKNVLYVAKRYRLLLQKAGTYMIAAKQGVSRLAAEEETRSLSITCLSQEEFQLPTKRETEAPCGNGPRGAEIC